jgi:NAD(P)-dependent dehydrogenase (short-subunit alcohol dehydrogenase family)
MSVPLAPLLEDRVVLVSGVGPGLGRSIALRGAAAGADVVLAARTESRLRDVAQEVEAVGRKAVVIASDISDEGTVANLATQSLAAFGRLDGLVHNAFALPPMTDLAKVDLDHVRANFETNVFAALRLTNLLAPALIERKGSVVMINSAVLRHSRQPYGAYKMTKSALLSLAQSLATELGPQGVRVNTVAPGYIWADTLKSYFEYLGGKRGITGQQMYDETAAAIDLRRLPEPDEIADAVVFLLSDMASAITGQCLDVNCGEFHH